MSQSKNHSGTQNVNVSLTMIEGEQFIPKTSESNETHLLPSEISGLKTTTCATNETENTINGYGAKSHSDLTHPVKKSNIITDFRRKCRDNVVYSENLRHSLCLALALFALGVTESQGGPTFLDLQIITNTDVGQASAFFTSHSCGYLVGSVTSGYISARKINASLTLLLSLLLMGIAVIVMPYCYLFGLMVTMRGLTGIFGGFIDTTSNAEHMRLWGKDGHVLMQLLHFCFALGGVVSPLVTEPFLAERKDDKSADDKLPLSLYANSNYQGHKNCSSNDSFYSADIYRASSDLNMSYANNLLINNNTNVVFLNSRKTNVHWAFLITGIIVILTSIPFVFLYIKSRQKENENKHEKTDANAVYHRKIPFMTKAVLVLGLGAFYVFYCSVEDTYANFLMTFVVRRFKTVSKSDGAHITAVYWSSFAASRFLMIFVSQALSPVRVLYVGLSLMLFSFTGFTISSGPWVGGGSTAQHTNATIDINDLTETTRDVAKQAGENGGSVPLLTFFAAMAALAMSGVFPAGLSWSGAELLKFTGRISSCVFISASIGAMLNPLLVSRLMRDVSNMWFCYVLLLEVSGLVLVFCSLLLFNRFYLNKRYGKLHGSIDVTVSTVVTGDAQHQILDTRCERRDDCVTENLCSIQEEARC